jgi:hypothetical protein
VTFVPGFFGAPNGRIGEEEREKNPLVYVIGGFRTAHRIPSCSTSRNPHLDSALDASEFIPGWIGWGFLCIQVHVCIKEK